MGNFEKTIGNFPVPFQGTKEQAKENYLTHSWYAYDDSAVCMECDAKVWHQVANYPCGVEPERMECTYEEWMKSRPKVAKPSEV